jgi:hypothetical protein
MPLVIDQDLDHEESMGAENFPAYYVALLVGRALSLQMPASKSILYKFKLQASDWKKMLQIDSVQVQIFTN